MYTAPASMSIDSTGPGFMMVSQDELQQVPEPAPGISGFVTVSAPTIIANINEQSIPTPIDFVSALEPASSLPIPVPPSIPNHLPLILTPNGSISIPNLNLIIIDPQHQHRKRTNLSKNRITPITPKPIAALTPEEQKIKNRDSALKKTQSELTDSQGLPLNSQNEVNEDIEERLFLSKETVTRSGRVTKPTIIVNQTRASDSHKFAVPTAPVPKVPRRRDPPDIFRCATCSKVYLGYVKLRKHFRQFPDHQASTKYLNTISPAPIRQTSIGIQAAEPLSNEIGNALPNSENGPGTSISFLQPPPSEDPESAIPSKLPRHTEPISGRSSATTTSTATTTSEELYNLTENISLPPLTPTALELQICSTSTPTEILHQQNLANKQSQANSSSNGGFWNVFSFNTGSGATTSNNRDLHSPTGHTFSIPIPGASGSNTNPKSDELSESQSSRSKTVWDAVEEKLTNGGVNQMISEIVDVADKLGKIARDKIIPIREDEEERLHSSVPIIRVDTPFLSHLLDLPFGTYMFREDGGIHRAPMPPPPELSMSLTAGEVDIDKFLSRDMENSLPSLSNLDIASICNN